MMWTGSRNRPNGYGLLSVNKVQYTSNRAAYLAWVGDIPDAMKVLHLCDNQPCINPTHLYLGTQKRNMQDTWERCNGGAGPARLHGPECAKAVREMAGRGLPVSDIARETGMSKANIYRVMRGEHFPVDRGKQFDASTLRKRQKFSEDELLQVLSLRDQGVSYSAIGRQIGMNTEYVRRLCLGRAKRSPRHRGHQE